MQGPNDRWLSSGISANQWRVTFRLKTGSARVKETGRHVDTLSTWGMFLLGLYRMLLYLYSRHSTATTTTQKWTHTSEPPPGEPAQNRPLGFKWGGVANTYRMLNLNESEAILS